MINQKTLVIGASGLVGRNLTEKIKEMTDTYATYNTTRFDSEGTRLYQMDVRDAYSVDDLLKKIRPDIVIDLAAQRNTRYCEKNPNEAYKVNVDGTKNIVNACKDTNAKMVFVSTDHVFDGTKGTYSEDNEPNPLNVYGKQKAMAEKIIKSNLKNWLIIRASYIYGLYPRRDNFVVWLLENFERACLSRSVDHEIRINFDRFVTPINVRNFVDVLITLLENDKRGVYHVGEECLSKYEFARRIKETFQFDDAIIKPVSSKALNQDVVRPKNNCLDLSKIKNELDFSKYTIENGLEIMKEEYIRLRI